MRTISIFVLVLSVNAHANVWNGVFNYGHHYACLGLDGVPISYDTPLESKCCSGGQIKPNADPSCRASIVTNIMGPAITAANGVTLANNVIQSTQNLHGTSTDFDTQVPLTSNNGVNEGASAASVAGSNVDDSDSDGAGTKSGSAGAYTSSSSGRPGASSANGGAGGLGSAETGMGNRISGSAVSAQGASLSNGKNSAGAYSGSGGNKKGDGDQFGFGKGIAMFGGKDGGSAAGDGQDYQLGENGKDGMAGNGGASADDESQGSAEDPGDYFNRTNKTDNIFKIVSARYLKKKSLWTIPQKLPEDLKQKKI